MIVMSRTRFGELTFPVDAELSFPQGLIGFSSETRFAIVERVGGAVAYLQSLRTPRLALPVLDATLLAPTYPDEGMASLAARIDCRTEDLLALVVIAVSPIDGGLRANLLAPLLIDASKRRGRQFILDPERYGASVPLGEAPVGETRMVG